MQLINSKRRLLLLLLLLFLMCNDDETYFKIEIWHFLVSSLHHHFPNLDNIPFNIINDMKGECKWLMRALNDRATVIGTSMEDLWFLEQTEDKPNNLQNHISISHSLNLQEWTILIVSIRLGVLETFLNWQKANCRPHVASSTRKISAKEFCVIQDMPWDK